MKHILDRPIWSALETRHQAFAQGDKLARRYPHSIVPFVATATDDADSLRARGPARASSWPKWTPLLFP